MAKNNQLDLLAADDTPKTLEINAEADLQWSELEAAEDGKPKIPTFSMLAYSGNVMRVGGWFRPVVVDLAGVKAAKTIPIFRDHDPSKIIGHGEVEISANEIRVNGVISAENEHSREVTANSRNGFPWQSSVGISVDVIENFKEGEKVVVNGKTISGPVVVARKSTLNESSFVPLGADRRTSAKVAAKSAGTKGDDMEFSAWLTANGWDEETLNDKQKAQLKAQYDAENAPPERDDETFDQIIAKQKEEQKRKAAITRIVQAAIEDRRNTINEREDTEKVEKLGRAALQGSTTPEKFELELLRAMRSVGPVNIISGGLESGGEMNSRVIEAAICKNLRLSNVEKQFGERDLEAADKHYRHGIGLQELILLAARSNGYQHISVSNLEAVLRAAFPPRDIKASGFSTISLPGILGNVLNKFLVQFFNSVESTWRQIAAIRSVRDFKQITSYSLTGNNVYEEVGPAGEIKHGELNEESYTNQVRTYGRMLAITRTDIINDDIGAFQRIPQILGRNGALKINNVFWTAFMDNSAFFTAARGNYDDGTDTVLDIDGLTNAETLFMNQTDPDGHPVGVTPRFLLVPNALNAKASTLMRSAEVRDTTANTTFETSNPHAGKFTVVRSSYLSNSAYTGNSALAWYLLADPMDMPVIEVAFLNGQEQPTIESADADFDTLGIQVRAYHDFGAAKQEYRGGVKMKGEA